MSEKNLKQNNVEYDVTVYMTAHNEEEDIGRSIESVLNQPGLKIQILVNDDASTDKTAEIARQYEDVTVYSNRKKAGVPASLNKLLSRAEGKYLFNTDADDYLEPESLSMLVAQAEQVYDMYQGKFFMFGHTMYHTANSTYLHKNAPLFEPHRMYRTNTVCSDILVPRTSFTTDGITYIEDHIHEDWAYMLSLIEAGYRGAPVDTLVLHYFHDNSGNYAAMGNEATGNMAKYFRMK